MSNPPPTIELPPTTIIGLSRQVLGTLPSHFLMLCIINLVFLVVVFLFESKQQQSRADLIGKLIDTCVLRVSEIDPPAVKYVWYFRPVPMFTLPDDKRPRGQ